MGVQAHEHKLSCSEDTSNRRVFKQQRKQLDEMLTSTFNSILRVEERSLKNRLTHGLTITEVHTIAAVGLHECSPMTVVASRLSVTLATLTIAVSRLVEKGFIERSRRIEDKRIVFVSLTKKGKQVWRVHELFHRQMIDAAFVGLNDGEKQVLSSAVIKVKLFFDTQSRILS